MASTRKSVAAQFFMDDDSPAPPGEPSSSSNSRHATPEPSGADDGSRDSASNASLSSRERIVELLNDAATSADTSEKLESLRKVQELLVHKEPVLLDNFLDEMMGFSQNNHNQEVRKFVVGFIEEACKKDPEILPDVIMNLQIMMEEDDPKAVAVQKRVIQAMTHIYKIALTWLSKAKTISEQMEATWSVICHIKDVINVMLEHSNDGIRTHTIKFMEMLVVTQTHTEEESIRRPNDFSLDDVPLTLKLVRPRKLEEEARNIFEELLKLHGSEHISSANLMTAMGSLANIAKFRPQFMPKVITALEMLQANLPPTLSKSQVSSVRKHLKNQLLALLKHKTAAENFFTNITTLLTDLGAGKEEVMRAMPKFDEMKRRARKAEAAVRRPDKPKLSEQEIRGGSRERENYEPSIPIIPAKRIKVDIPDASDSEESEEEKMDMSNKVTKKFSQEQMESAVDITEQFIMKRMNPVLAAELVLRSMNKLPGDIPAQFHHTYTPIAAAGTEGQVKHVSRLLAAQLTAVNIGPGVEEMRERRKRTESIEQIEVDQKIEAIDEKMTISVIGSSSLDIKRENRDPRQKKSEPVKLQPSGMNKKPTRTRTLKLAEITKQLKSEERKAMMIGAIKRILNAERSAIVGGIPKIRTKVITTLVAQYGSELKDVLLNYIFEDIHKRVDLAFSWLFEEYCFYQGFNKGSSVISRRTDDSEYNTIFCQLIQGVIKSTDGKDRENLLRRLYLESPIITEEAIMILKQFVQVEGNAITVVNLMKDLVMKRPTKKLNFLNFLLEFCSHETSKVRETANQIVLQMHSTGDIKDIIEDYSVMYLRFLISPTPPTLLFGEDRGRPKILDIWTEDIVKACLYLFLSLLPKNQKLFKHLVEVYTSTKAQVSVDFGPTQGGIKSISVQRTILRELAMVVGNIPIDSPELLDLIETCPEGSEILVTRIVHILTEKSLPTPELVEKFKKLYHDRSQDVRLLIPVLNGMTKQEIIQVLPKLIQLSNVVVKEVFGRLLGISNSIPEERRPLSAVDIIIALHNIDLDKKEKHERDALVSSVRRAVDLCFTLKQTYTTKVLTIALQQLLNQPGIPLLLMRTIIQVLKHYPKLIEFVINSLQKLILKQVWKQSIIWDGFIKCCKETVPQSYSVILQLPPTQLGDFLNRAPNLREPLLEHVQAFTEAQRRHISANTMAVLYNVSPEAEIQPPTNQEDKATDAAVESKE